MPVNILLVVDFSSFGGTRTYFNQLMELYQNLGYQVFLAFDPEIMSKSGFSMDSHQEIYLPGWYSISSKGSFSWMVNQVLFLWNQVLLFFVVWYQARKNKIDLVVASVGASERYISILALPFPCLYIIHTTPQKSKRSNFLKVFFYKFLSSSNQIVAVSKYMKKEICNVWGCSDKDQYVLVIYNGLKEIISQLPANSTNQNNPMTILTLGHVVAYKNPEMWIQVAEHLNKDQHSKLLNWVWAGDGEMLESCRSSIQTKKLNNVSFIGYCQNVYPLYEQAVLYFQPSVIESFGLSVLDAMQMSLPCVVTRVGGLTELVIDGETGFIVDDVNGAVEKINWLLVHPEERKRMGECGRKRYYAHFTHMRWLNDMTQLHVNILK